MEVYGLTAIKAGKVITPSATSTSGSGFVRYDLGSITVSDSTNPYSVTLLAGANCAGGL